MTSQFKDTTNFYRSLPRFKEGLLELYAKDSSFTTLPDDWSVVVADIKDSTLAIANNQHNAVNLAATGCIVAVLNKLKSKKKNRVPYFFGGDGTTFLVPESYTKQVMKVLELHRDYVKAQWNLELVIGSLASRDIYAKGGAIKLAKIQLNNYLQIPVVLGTGLKLAEDYIKETYSSLNTEVYEPKTPDLSGLQCRWENIAPPKSDYGIICLLIYCSDDANQRVVYSKVFNELNLIFGELAQRQPISTPKLKLNARFENIKREVLASTGNVSYRAILGKIFETYMGKLYFRYSKAGRRYLRMTKDLSETVMLDGLINTIISGTPEKTEVLVRYLDKLESENQLVYGLHLTDSSVLSCYVEDMVRKHIHFVDGTDGGYTKAAEMLKAKLT